MLRTAHPGRHVTQVWNRTKQGVPGTHNDQRPPDIRGRCSGPNEGQVMSPVEHVFSVTTWNCVRYTGSTLCGSCFRVVGNWLAGETRLLFIKAQSQHKHLSPSPSNNGGITT